MKLFESIDLKGIHSRNHILRSATWEGLCDEKGYMSEKQYDIYKNLAKNHVGIISTGYARVDAIDCPNAGMMGIYQDEFIPQYKRLTELVHEQGSAIIMQIAYGGTKAVVKVEDGKVFAPSAIPDRATGIIGKVMTKEDITYVVNEYAEAAVRVKKAGFDAVQIHGAHSYLLNQFLSPYYNNRTDEYGGSLLNRYRFVDEIIHAIRAAVGEDFPIWIKAACSEFFDGGMSFEEALEICRMLEKSGIDVIEVTGNIHGKAQTMIGQSFDGQIILNGGYFYEYGKIIAETVKIPVFVTGGFCDPKEMEEKLAQSQIAGFGISRPLLTEPELVGRWESGDLRKAKCEHCSKCRTPEGNYCTTFGIGCPE